MKRELLRRGFAAAAMIACFAGFSAAHAQDAYKIGYITDLSGPLAGSYTPTWEGFELYINCLLYTSPSPRDRTRSRMPSSA